jgi:predicted anti-sigma-YlaC factor YlaD
VHEKVSEMLSAFLDDELTQAESQQVRIHVEDCADCSQTLEDLRALHETARSIEFPQPDREELERLDQALSVRAPRVAGWALILFATAIWIGFITYRFLTQPSIDFIEMVGAGAVIGFVLLFVSVLRQRLLEAPHDRYRRVRK